MRSIPVAALAFLVMAATGVPADAEPPQEYGKALAAADWSKMETVIVTLSEYAFTPSTLAFKEGVPAKLVIRNAGKANHYFVSGQFFGAIATRKVQSSDGEIKAPFFDAVEVYPGKTVEWFLIPMKKGTFGLLCTVQGHAEHGMKGTIEVR
ncbi:MAG: hypothetical protein C3F14_10960 [Deltaproteobacteria bacterium]|nr:MAG: hypothetical protein C3F14_10960 [Deltaproteobacteria bacterium]